MQLADARHVLVTGAAGAIGGALAELLERECPRARMTLVDRHWRSPPAIDKKPLPNGVVWDLSKPDTLEAAWADVVKDGDVDVLVNCAGFMELVSFAGTPWELGRTLLDVDLVSPLRLMSLAVPSMTKAKRGAVVNVASLAGLVPLRGASYYGAAKAGLAMASEIAHLELRPHGVDVVTVYPGPVASELERRARAQVPATFVSRAIPTGDARGLASAVVRAVKKRAGRV
ncbi:MAG TPA: SDR family NAD(P)-dependent oxidoreductase, partial [Polyangiaceae bacterium]